MIDDDNDDDSRKEWFTPQISSPNQNKRA